MGIILPNILDYALNFITKDSTIYENSILVCKSMINSESCYIITFISLNFL